VNRAKIDEAANAVVEAQEALQRAQKQHIAEILAESERIVNERLEAMDKRDEARQQLASIHAEKRALEDDIERHFASYQLATFQGDADTATNAQAAGDVARGQLEQLRADEDMARANLEAADFDDCAADDVLRHGLSTVQNLAPESEREEIRRQVAILTRPLKHAMEDRALAKTIKTRHENEQRRRAELNQYRDSHGVVHLPKQVF
jgi:hypothetical protein